METVLIVLQLIQAALRYVSIAIKFVSILIALFRQR